MRKLKYEFEWFKYANKLPISFLLMIFSGSQAVAQGTGSLGPDAAVQNSTIVDAFGAKYVSLASAPIEQARVLVYRPGPMAKAEPVNIYLNGRYHTSLLRGGYTEFCAAAGTVAFHAVLADAKKLHTGRLGVAQTWSFQPGKTLLLKVQEPGRLTEISSEQAQGELSGTAKQIHTISRSPLVQDCQEPAPVVAKVPTPAATPIAANPPAPKPAVPRLYALESDALFEFGKAELRASSYNAIEIMAQRLKQDFNSVERIRVVGHTDAIGKPKTNAKLSMDRAKAVAAQLQDRGLKPSKGFKIEGEGAAHLVKLRCGNQPTPENKICHAPNRRVEIVVTGARR